LGKLAKRFAVKASMHGSQMWSTVAEGDHDHVRPHRDALCGVEIAAEGAVGFG
jgi:hypothetical protein